MISVMIYGTPQCTKNLRLEIYTVTGTDNEQSYNHGDTDRKKDFLHTLHCIQDPTHSLRSLPYDRSITCSKASSPQTAI
jgi:hypothetical protein